MNDQKNPFASHRKDANSKSASTLIPWVVAGLALMVALFFLMFWTHTKTSRQQELDALQAKLAQADDALRLEQSENQTNRDLIGSLQTQVSDLQKEKELAGQMAKNLENEMRSDLESKDVTISNLKGKLTVNILDSVMFDSGEAVLKPDGAAVMQKIAALLTTHPQLKIHVIGHTDNVPIKPAAQNRFASNWELSSVRALAAVHYLTEKAGIDPRRVGAVGYGEFRPIADNTMPEGRAKNRRITIAILPDELMVTDTPPTKNSWASPLTEANEPTSASRPQP